MFFTSNVPNFSPDGILPTPERIGTSTHYTGRGVVMAFIDSGFSNHADLAGRILLHVDATTAHIREQAGVTETNDLSWHGQMTSVIACGDGTTSGGRYKGAASASQVVLVKVSSPRWQIKEADILRGLRWVIDTHRRTGVRVVNLSVGGDKVSTDPNHPLHRAIKRLHDAGVVVLCASGNSGAERILPPASSPHAIVVGGYNDHNTLNTREWTTYHSNYGLAYDGTPRPDVLAPAIWIPSPILPHSSVDRDARWLGGLVTDTDHALERLMRDGYADLGLRKEDVVLFTEKLHHLLQARINSHKLIDAHHQHVDGTSVAVAIASAVVAQMLEANPALTPSQIRDLLMDTAHVLPGVPERQGAGRMDAAAAIRHAERLAHAQPA
jgi:serine protease AprX